VLEYDELSKLYDYEALNKFRQNALNPDNPVLRGTVQNSDIHFQQREVANRYYNELPDIVESYMEEINKLTGREYHLFNYYGAKDADRVIVAMGSMCETIEEMVDYLNDKGEKVGVITVHLYRPFSLKHFFKDIPKTVKKVAVLDRTKEMGALAEPLYLDVKSAFYSSDMHPQIVGGRAGVGGKEVLPREILAVFENLKQAKPQDNFTVGIIDDVNNSSLPFINDIDVTPQGTKTCKFWGLGSDGTVGANKNAIKIIGDHTDMYAQGYFAYDSKKSGGVTISHLRFGCKPIKAPYLINKADFIACHNQSYVDKYNVLSGLKAGGSFLLNCSWNEAELDKYLPADMKRYVFENKINFYTIDAVSIARELGLGGRINMIMQAAFFEIAAIIPGEDAVKYLKAAVEKSYGHKGEKVVAMNNAAIDKGMQSICKVTAPKAWGSATKAFQEAENQPPFIKNVMIPMNRQEGDSLPVSAFLGLEDGTFPMGTAAYEKRGVAVNVPAWKAKNCVECNRCSYVCPHAAIRPALMTKEELDKAPKGLQTKPFINQEGLYFSLTVSPNDCLGCGSCVEVCPAKEKALEMKPLEAEVAQEEGFNYCLSLKPKTNPMDKFSVKGSQFEQPLLEFSGACAGCAQTPYAKLVTQLYGDRMMVANATGCSSVWAGSAPAVPYTKNHQGHGPAWGNSLFEDNAEFGLGMLMGVKQMRQQLALTIKKAAELPVSQELRSAMTEWLLQQDNSEQTRERADKLIMALQPVKDSHELLQEIYENKAFLVKRSQWLFGGDGWAYDIGFGGLDHVLASGEDINVLVFDTEVYSNTGGQSSKATPAAAIAKFAAGGKKTKKKDLGMMAMSYGYVYVAQIAMGADRNQTLQAIKEAEAYPGPSLVIAYAPCINHGLKVGMGSSQLETKRAVESGYWALYRYNPQLKGSGNNPFMLDSKEPTMGFRDFLMGEVRYSSLKKKYPETAEELFKKTEQDAKERLDNYKKLANRYGY
jgi:pyruvate-ferredoxin/flavodoxin oxidoreductase